MHPLGTLIQSIQYENGWSNVDIANRAIERGHKSSKQSIGEYKNKPIVSINARQVNLLSDALGVAAMTVVRAAGQSMGIQDHLGSEDELKNVVRTTTDLSERDKRPIMSLLYAVRINEAREHDSDNYQPCPPTPLRFVSEGSDAENVVLEQKIAADDRELGKGIGPGDLPDHSFTSRRKFGPP